jgi:hypothetical protein
VPIATQEGHLKIPYGAAKNTGVVCSLMARVFSDRTRRPRIARHRVEVRSRPVAVTGRPKYPLLR